MWTRPADRAPSYGTYGQGVDKCAALAHPLPTLGALATTSSPLQQLDQGQQARAPSAPSRLPGPGARGGMLDEKLAAAPDTALHGDQGSLTLAAGWPMASPDFNQGRNNTAKPGERSASAPGPSRPVSRSNHAGIPVKCSRNRRQVRRNPHIGVWITRLRSSVGRISRRRNPTSSAPNACFMSDYAALIRPTGLSSPESADGYGLV